jgi:hypothetical protein
VVKAVMRPFCVDLDSEWADLDWDMERLTLDFTTA